MKIQKMSGSFDFGIKQVVSPHLPMSGMSGDQNIKFGKRIFFSVGFCAYHPFETSTRDNLIKRIAHMHHLYAANIRVLP